MALYQSKGILSYISEIKSGTSQSGNTWKRQTIHLDVPGFQGSIFKQIFQVSGNAVDMVEKFSVGDKVEVTFSLYAREWEGKWYNNVDLVTITAQEQPAAPREDTAAPAPAGEDGPDLPF